MKSQIIKASATKEVVVGPCKWSLTYDIHGALDPNESAESAITEASAKLSKLLSANFRLPAAVQQHVSTKLGFPRQAQLPTQGN